MKNLLTVSDVRKTFSSGKLVLNDVTFDLNKGECLGLVGESGCGKSTLAKCLMQIEKIDSGSISLNGHAIEKLSIRQLRPYRSKMQIVFQNASAALNPKLKIKDSLIDPYEQFGNEIQLKYFNYTSKEQFVSQLLEAVELPPEIADRYPHEISGGQRQRVTIARAISIEPKIVILDEPTASLDVLSQKAVLTLLKKLQQKLDLSYLFISHDLAIVSQMCQRMIVMKSGEIIDKFSSDELLNEERHAYTKELVEIF